MQRRRNELVPSELILRREPPNARVVVSTAVLVEGADGGFAGGVAEAGEGVGEGVGGGGGGGGGLAEGAVGVAVDHGAVGVGGAGDRSQGVVVEVGSRLGAVREVDLDKRLVHCRAV